MREITKFKLGIPFYDHLNGLRMEINELEATRVIVAKHLKRKEVSHVTTTN